MTIPLLQEIVATVVVTLLLAAITIVATQRGWIFPLIYHTTVGRNKDIRVSMASLLRLSYSGKYILIRSVYRREAFGPFGGVCKYFDTAKPDLDSCHFIPQTPKPRVEPDMKNDLRGYIKGRNLYKFLKWFNTGKDRESNSLPRELKEELNDIGLFHLTPLVDKLEFRHIRKIIDHINRVDGASYSQFRRLDIYEIIPNQGGEEFIREIYPHSLNNKDLLLASPNEIFRGRSIDGEHIGSHVAYLLSDTRTRPEDPPFE